MARFEATIRKLRTSTALDAQDIASITALPIDIKELPVHIWTVRERQTIAMLPPYPRIHQRSKASEEGKLQILSIDIAGDIPDVQNKALVKHAKFQVQPARLRL